jgi:hypothetical protein
MSDFGKAGIDGVVLDGGPAAVALAVGFGEFAVHVNETDGTGALVEIVYVLRAKKEAVTDACLKFGQRVVGGVGLGFCSVGSAPGVELPDEFGITLPGVGSADVFNAIAGP